MALSTLTLLCNHHCNHLQILLAFPNWNSVPFKHCLPIPTLLSPGTTIPLSISMTLTTLGTLCKWNYTVLSFSHWLISLKTLKGQSCGTICQNFEKVIFKLEPEYRQGWRKGLKRAWEKTEGGHRHGYCRNWTEAPCEPSIRGKKEGWEWKLMRKGQYHGWKDLVRVDPRVGVLMIGLSKLD